MFLLVDKPLGRSSFDVVAHLKSQLTARYPIETAKKRRKIGHGGTLDPNASGLLLVATDQDTKRLGDFLSGPKTYETTIIRGKETDTRDSQPRAYEEQYPSFFASDGQTIHGHTINEKHIDGPSINDLIGRGKSREGTHDMPLPPFRASKRAGRPLYELARAGYSDIDTKPMTFHTITITEYTYPLLSLSCTVSGGTYIRSLAYDLGMKYGIPCCLLSLRRTGLGTQDGMLTNNTPCIREEQRDKLSVKILSL